MQIFNATRPEGLDGWTMDERQYELMRRHILEMIDDEAGEYGTVLLKEVVAAAQDRYASHELFPKDVRGTTARSPRWTSKLAMRLNGWWDQAPSESAAGENSTDSPSSRPVCVIPGLYVCGVWSLGVLFGLGSGRLRAGWWMLSGVSIGRCRGCSI